MNLGIKHFLVILFLLYGFPNQSFSQNKNLVKPSTDEIKTAAREIIKSTGTCALITIDSEGGPRARAMETLIPDDDFIIWFGTNPKSRKVSQIKNDSKVTIYYLDKDESGYVMLYGNAEIVDDKKAKKYIGKMIGRLFTPIKRQIIY